MLGAAWWGFVGGAALMIGAFLGIYLPVSSRFIGLVMAFGAGVLISAVAFELAEEAYQRSGGTAVVLGLLAAPSSSATGSSTVPAVTDARAPTGHSRPPGPMALVLGALLDGIPQSAAIGVSLLGGAGVGLPVVAAVFMSNIPESMSASAGLKKTGRSTRYVLGLWTAVLAASTTAAALGYLLLDGADPVVVAVIQAFAAGAILTMLADTMVPEAVEHAGAWVGLLTALGFVAAFLLSMA